MERKQLMPPQWKTYEEVAAFVLDQLSRQFGIDRVEGKQKVSGKSGTKWEIDAKGVRDSDGAFYIIECRRFTKTKQSQAKMAALAYQIMDTGAAGGIIVSIHGLQGGAAKVASAGKIEDVRLPENSTKYGFVLRALGVFMTMGGGGLSASGSAEPRQYDAQGNEVTPLP